MSVRTHTWTTKSGEQRQSYLVQYSTAELDSRGKRMIYGGFTTLLQARDERAS